MTQQEIQYAMDRVANELHHIRDEIKSLQDEIKAQRKSTKGVDIDNVLARQQAVIERLSDLVAVAVNWRQMAADDGLVIHND